MKIEDFKISQVMFAMAGPYLMMLVVGSILHILGLILQVVLLV